MEHCPTLTLFLPLLSAGHLLQQKMGFSVRVLLRVWVQKNHKTQRSRHPDTTKHTPRGARHCLNIASSTPFFPAPPMCLAPQQKADFAILLRFRHWKTTKISRNTETTKAMRKRSTSCHLIACNYNHFISEFSLISFHVI